MHRQYPRHFRRAMLNRMLAGESVLSLVQETFVPEQPLHRWKHQALVYQSRVDWVNSTESGQLRDTKKRIKALENELQLVKDASPGCFREKSRPNRFVLQKMGPDPFVS